MNDKVNDIKAIYIHIPFCLSKCKYCDFFSIPCSNKINPIPDDYVECLLYELEYKINLYNITSVKTIYIGGGTPSLLSITQLKKILSFIQTKKLLEDNYEFTIEMNPDDITEELLIFLQNSIINRISCGIQSMTQKVLERVNRRAGVVENVKALELLKSKWNKNLSLDLISALPEEKTEEFLKNLSLICDYEPEHISLYSLTIEEETKLGQELEANLFNYDFDYADDMWLQGKNLLEKRGYIQYEISNFCKPGFQCKHNLFYWNHESYLGIGAGAAESIYTKDGTAVRYANKTNIEEYIKFWLTEDRSDINKTCTKEIVDLNNSKFEFFMMGLRKASGISDLQYKNCFGENIPETIVNQFIDWKEKKLVDIKQSEAETYYSLNKQGLLFLNKFLQELDI